MRTEVGKQLGKNGFYFAFIVLLSTVVFAEVIEPAGLTGTYSVSSGTIAAADSCPSWFTALHRNSTDSYTNEYLTVELDGCQVFGYEVYTMQQGAPTGYLADLEAGDLFIVWDEDEEHGGNTDFEFTGELVVVDENGCDLVPVVGSCDYARVSSTNEEVINWVLYRVESAGTLTVNSTGLNEHDAIHLQRNYVDFEKTDNVDDCVSPTDEFEYTITWNNTSLYDFSDVYVVDWLPDGVNFDDFVEGVIYQPITPPLADPNVIYGITDANGLDDIILPVGQSIRLYLTKETFEEDVFLFYLEADISDPNWGWIDNTEYDPNNPGTAEILAQPRASFFDYYGPGSTQPEGIQFFAASFAGPMEDGSLASFVYTATQPGYVVLTLVNYDNNSATLEKIIIRQTDPNDPNYVPEEPNEPEETILAASSVDGEYDPNTHSITWQIGDIAAGDNGIVSFSVIVNYKAEPGMSLHNVAEAYAGQSLIARASVDTPVCCWDTGHIIYVDKTANGNNTGTSWTDAYTELQDALNRARNSTCEDVNTIYIAAETYNPGPNTGDSFEIPEGVSVYGGFPSGGCDFGLRNPKHYETILTGRIDPNNRNETVVVLGDETMLDGVIVQDAGGAQQPGQGILCENVSAAITNCVVRNNSGFSYGIYADNSDVEIKWCWIENNGRDGIRHIGNEKSITIENCQINDNQRYGLYLYESASILKNNVICRNGVDGTIYFGIWLESPSAVPMVYNNTIAYNRNEAVFYLDEDPNHINTPDIQNCIIWYNNREGSTEQFAGWKVPTQYSCVYDPNDADGVSETIDGNHNFSHKPDFAYPYSDDPNVPINVHLAYDSFCKDKGSPGSYANQKDMDDEERVADSVVDVGADEIHCSEISNALDWDADGIVNLNEFRKFSDVWLAHDPNDPAVLDPNSPENDPNSPSYIDPNSFIGWDDKCNLFSTGTSQYTIDVADLLVFLEDAPWLWVACWRTDILEIQQQMSMLALSESEGMMASVLPETSQPVEAAPVMSVIAPAASVVQPVEIVVTESIEPEEKSIEEQIADLQEAIQFLESIGNDPNTQLEIQASDWQQFMNDVYNSLTELQENDIITQDKVEE